MKNGVCGLLGEKRPRCPEGTPQEQQFALDSASSESVTSGSILIHSIKTLKIGWVVQTNHPLTGCSSQGAQMGHLLRPFVVLMSLIRKASSLHHRIVERACP